MYSQVFFSDDARFGVAIQQLRKVGRYFPAPGMLLLPNRGTVEDWKSLILRLDEGGYADYLASDLGCRLCSRRLKELLEQHTSKETIPQWLPVEVQRGDEKRDYYILHFPTPADVLDREATHFAGDVVVKPVLSREKIGELQLFSYPEGAGLSLFVSDSVRHAIEAAGCTGALFLPIRVQ